MEENTMPQGGDDTENGAVGGDTGADTGFGGDAAEEGTTTPLPEEGDEDAEAA
jgi:hypothetical protein